MRKKRLLFVGVLDIPWSDNIPLKRAFEKKGYIVDTFNFRSVAKELSICCRNDSRLYFLIDQVANCLKLPFFPSFVREIGYTLNGRKGMNQKLFEAVKRGDYDLVFFAKADIVNYTLIPEINRYADTWYFFMDPPDIALKINASRYANKSTWSSASCSRVCHSFIKAGGNSFFIPEGVDTEIFYPKETKKKWDITFVGSRTWGRKRFFDALKRRGIKVNLFGRGFPFGPVYSGNLAQIYRESKIVLNLCRPGGGFSVRVFQAMGTGSMMLSGYSEDLQLVFHRGRHLDWFHNTDECARLIRYYLQNEKEREQIAYTGMQYVNSNYSWEKTAERIIHFMSDSSHQTKGSQPVKDKNIKSV